MTRLPSLGIRYASSAHLDESAMTHLAALRTNRPWVTERSTAAHPLPRCAKSSSAFDGGRGSTMMMITWSSPNSIHV